VSEKILSVDDLAARLRRLREMSSPVVVHCHGCFDLMHIGHIKHLQAAKRLGDTLVVTVTPDEHVAKGPGRPVFSEGLRAEALAALACVDFVAVAREPTAVEAIRLLRPDYYVKGQEFEHRAPPPRLAAEMAALGEVGGAMRFTREAVVFSSSALLRELRVE